MGANRTLRCRYRAPPTGLAIPGEFLIKDIVTFDGKRLTKSANA